MEVDLAEAVSSWFGCRVRLVVELGIGDDRRAVCAAQGFLDGPYVGDDPGTGVAIAVGAERIAGNIVIHGTLVDISVEPNRRTFVGEKHCELPVAALPPATLDGGTLTVTLPLIDGTAGRLVIVQEADA